MCCVISACDCDCILRSIAPDVSLVLCKISPFASNEHGTYSAERTVKDLSRPSDFLNPKDHLSPQIFAHNVPLIIFFDSLYSVYSSEPYLHYYCYNHE